MRLFKLIKRDGGFWVIKHDSREKLYEWLETCPTIEEASGNKLELDLADVVQVMEMDIPKWDHTPLDSNSSANWPRYFPPVASRDRDS